MGKVSGLYSLGVKMRRLSLFLFSLLASTSLAQAQEAVLSLDGDLVLAAPASKEEEKKETEDKADVAAKKEDKGIFSFLNFWGDKKKTEVTVEPGSTETVLQKLTRTAAEGDVNSQLTLGYMYLYGEDGVSVDHKKAFDYYKMAAERKDNVAINNLGSLYYSGIGTPRNPLMAAKMFAAAAELGNVEAMVNLAFIYLSGQGIVQNPEEAIHLFEKAAESDNPTANFMLGYAYFRGYIVEKDFRHAFDLIRKSANAGYDDAQFILSLMYMNGWGTPQNYGNAVKALNKAMAQGNIDAMMELGNILAIGQKYPRNIYKAHILFNVASVRGADDADNRRNVLEKNLKIEELLQAQTEAEAYVEKPSELTVYIHQTFGPNIKKYIDDGLAARQKRNSSKK